MIKETIECYLEAKYSDVYFFWTENNVLTINPFDLTYIHIEGLSNEPKEYSDFSVDLNDPNFLDKISHIIEEQI